MGGLGAAVTGGAWSAASPAKGGTSRASMESSRQTRTGLARPSLPVFEEPSAQTERPSVRLSHRYYRSAVMVKLLRLVRFGARNRLIASLRRLGQHGAGAEDDKSLSVRVDRRRQPSGCPRQSAWSTCAGPACLLEDQLAVHVLDGLDGRFPSSAPPTVSSVALRSTLMNCGRFTLSVVPRLHS